MVHRGGARVSMGILNELNGLNTEKRKMVIKKLPSGWPVLKSPILFERLPFMLSFYSYREIVTNQVD